MHASIDGKTVADVSTKENFRQETEFFSLGIGRPNTLFEQTAFQSDPPMDIVGVDLSPAKAAGYYVMIENLSRGVHTIEFVGKTEGGFSTETKDLLLVI